MRLMNGIEKKEDLKLIKQEQNTEHTFYLGQKKKQKRKKNVSELVPSHLHG